MLSLSRSIRIIRGLLLFCALILFFIMCLDIRESIVTDLIVQDYSVDNGYSSMDNSRSKGDIDTNMDKSSHQFNSEHKAESKPVVPSLVNVIWFYPPNTTFRFHQLLSLLSVHKHIAPSIVMFWYNNMPCGAWWRFARETLPNLYLMYREPPQDVFHHDVKVVEHQSDVARLDILLKHGGIYIDLDVIIVKSLSSLLHYPVTMGAESPHLLGSGIILAEKNATFLSLWYQQYKSFDDSQWNYHSVVIPMQLAVQHPQLIHIEWFSLQRPNWDERQWLYTEGKLWAWQQDNMAVHLWYREYNVDHNPHSIRTWNTTAGEIFRYIYYGSTDIM